MSRAAARALLLALAACSGGRPTLRDVAAPPEVLVDVLPRSALLQLEGRSLGNGSMAVPLPAGPARLRISAPGFHPAEIGLDPAAPAGRAGVALRPEGFGAARTLHIDEPGGLAAASVFLLRQGRAPEALEYAERAVDLAPAAAAPNRALGMALLELPSDRKRQERAAQALSAYLAAAPDAPDRGEVAATVSRLRGDFSIPPHVR
jgi:tetratricopeptide (TPR) repeat protein